MKQLKDFKEDINKCSKCGLCQSVCPVYKETGNDCAVSRGKFVMLEGVLKGDLKLNKTIIKYMDLCLKCGKCKDFCPSGIDACKIFETAKYEYTKNTFGGKFVKFLQSEYVFGNLLKLFSRRTPRIQGKKGERVLYFRGCADKIFPNTEKALKKILSHYDIELTEKDFDCCGQPFLSSGNLERFEQVKKNNITLMQGDFDCILTDCASCESTLKSYFDNPEYSYTQILNIGEFLAKHPKKFVFKKKTRVTFHTPCHLENSDFIKDIISQCENVEYVEMEGVDDCCGFAGEFALKNNKISRTIGRKKAQNIMNTNTDYVLTLCPACILGIKQGFMANGNFKHQPILNLVEFLSQADKII